MLLYRCGSNEQKPKDSPRDCLGQYFLDQIGNLYSMNSHTYCTKYGYRMFKLSDGSKNQLGQLHNTLRTPWGNKITITRAELITKYLNKRHEVDHSSQEGSRIYASYYKMLQQRMQLVTDHTDEVTIWTEFGHGLLYLLATMCALLILSLYFI